MGMVQSGCSVPAVLTAAKGLCQAAVLRRQPFHRNAPVYRISGVWSSPWQCADWEVKFGSGNPSNPQCSGAVTGNPSPHTTHNREKSCGSAKWLVSGLAIRPISVAGDSPNEKPTTTMRRSHSQSDGWRYSLILANTQCQRPRTRARWLRPDFNSVRLSNKGCQSPKIACCC